MMFIQITQRPEGPTRLDPASVRQSGIRQGLDIGFFQLDLVFAALPDDGCRQAAIELVVDIGGEIKLGFVDRQPFLAAFAFFADAEASDIRRILRIGCGLAIEDNADGGVERVVADGSRRYRFGGGVLRPGSLCGFHPAKFVFEGCDAALIGLFHGAEFGENRLGVGRRLCLCRQEGMADDERARCRHTGQSIGHGSSPENG